MATVDYTAFAGDTITVIVSVTDEDGAALDVTGATATYSVSRNVYTDALLSKTVGAGIVISGAEVTITLAPADTEALLGAPAEAVYHHELEVIDTGGGVSTVLHGNVRIRGTLI